LNLLERLRVETASEHERAERIFDVELRTSSIGAYRELLQRFYAFHATWEPLVEAAIDQPSFFGPRRKLELLKRDLRALHTVDGELPRVAAHTIGPMRSSVEAFGSMYVVEGSTLGGTIIARVVERRLGYDRQRGCSYFRCYGDDVNRMWISFQAAMLASCRPEDDEAVILSAKRTFCVLCECLR
jgi:heme oxygenase (biliverdin-IX-beta and delta-forming)